ncbi:hypothetical protein ABZ362_32400 [Streptomyces sp. NPDC005951]
MRSGPAPAVVVTVPAITTPEVTKALGDFDDITVHRDKNVAEIEI